MIKAYFQEDEFLMEDGNPDKEKIIKHTIHLLEHTLYGYRFIYSDVDNQVSLQ